MAGEPLAAVRQGSGERIVLLHGFTQTARCWGQLPARLSVDREVVALDAPGHGDSPGATDLWHTADLIAATAGRGTYLGYSMGARMALHVALAHPEVMDRLVLVSGTAGLDSEEDRAARRAADGQLADHLEEVGVERFLAEWLAGPLFAGLPRSEWDLAERQRNTAARLATSLRLAGTGTQDPLWDRLGDIGVPVLVVAGADDTKFSRSAERMARGIGRRARLEVVAGAGHTVHRERPEAFGDLLAGWLRPRWVRRR
jgi:2-succinyl-6-hydroxy-2,4-cyclohexadiene-1-carboxylate synthase